jgi:uncharacterized protein (DUF736 family)
MGSFGGFLLLKVIELKLILVLLDAYGSASSLGGLYAIFKGQTELAQIGTIASVISVGAIIIVTVRRLAIEAVRAWRWLKKVHEAHSLGDLSSGDTELGLCPCDRRQHQPPALSWRLCRWRPPVNDGFSPALRAFLAPAALQNPMTAGLGPPASRAPSAGRHGAVSKSQETDMIIGKFTHEVTKFVGHIKTLGFESDVVIQPVAKHGEKSPDYRLVDKQGFEIGIAYEGISERQNRYLTVYLDSPTFPESFRCALVNSENGWQLKWERPKQKDATKVEKAGIRKAA